MFRPKIVCVDGQWVLRTIIVCRCQGHRLVDLVVKAATTRAPDQGCDSRMRRGDFSGSSHTSDLKIGTPLVPCQAPGVIESIVSEA